MLVDYDTLPEILISVVIFFCLYYIVVFKFVYSILDPLFIYIFSLSFSSVLVITVLDDQPKYLMHFFICQAFFFIGFILIFNITKKDDKPTVVSSNKFFDYHILRITFYVLFVVYFIGNIVTLYTTGFALLNDDPTLAKVENFSKGIGIIFVINLGVGGFLTSTLLFYILTKPKITDFVLLIVILIFTSLEGSKGGLLRILITLTLLLNHSLFSHKHKFIKVARLLIPLGLLLALVVIFTVLSKENSDSEQAFFAFIRRLLYGADALFTFYLPVNEQYFARFQFWDYPSHFFNQILAFLRITENHEALGNVMVANAFPNRVGTIVGPNTPFNIEGQIFFGYYGAIVYSMIVGGIYAYIRQYFFQKHYYSAFWFVFTACISQQASALVGEVTYFVIQAFYSCFFVIPVYILVAFAVQGKFSLRGLRFKLK